MRAEMPWDDGTLDDINVETLQSPAWIRDHDVHVGGCVPIPMDLAEMGLPEALQAKVLAIERCPPIDDGPGRVVLTTINHLNADVMELTVETANGRRETFQPTGAHKLYRASDNRWVSAWELRQGDQLAGTEEPLTVVDSRHVPGVHRVYNMTVQGEHVYHVSSLGALVHNVKCSRLVTGVDPSEIRFSQSSVANTIGTPNGPRPMRKLVKDLVGGRLSADDLPPIRVFGKDGHVFTLDNRRLKAFQVAGKPINTVRATAKEIAAEAWKFTTKNGGTSVTVRGGGL
jgi:hypothetical protein